MGLHAPHFRSSALPVAIGDVVDKYRVERVIGQGAMGVVVAARHVTLDQVVAIKFLLINNGLGSQEEGIARFVAEARAAARIESDHVCRVFDVAMLPDGTPYMIMEYLDGNDLEDELSKRGQLEVTEAVDYVMQALDAIQAAHHRGVVHRDLKPANLFLARRADGSRRVKVLDFGISKTVEASGPQNPRFTRKARSMGSPAYMPPEQIRDPRNVDHRADLWALGAILYESLTGELAFVGPSIKAVFDRVLEEDPVPLHALRPDVPQELVSVVSSALQRDRALRWPSAAAFARALAGYGSIGVMTNLTNIQREVGSLEAISISRVRVSVVRNKKTTDPAAARKDWMALQKRQRNARTAVLMMISMLLCAAAAAIVFMRPPAPEKHVYPAHSDPRLPASPPR